MGKVLILRTCDKNMQSYHGFQWPLSGRVEALDWAPGYECGRGLHGFLWGEGDSGYVKAGESNKWLVVETDSEVVESHQHKDWPAKCRFPYADVVFVGTRHEATQYLYANGGADRAILYLERSGGDHCVFTGGDFSVFSGGDLCRFSGRSGCQFVGRSQCSFQVVDWCRISCDYSGKVLAGAGCSVQGGACLQFEGGAQCRVSGLYSGHFVGGDFCSFYGRTQGTFQGGKGCEFHGWEGSTYRGGMDSMFFGRHWDTHKMKSMTRMARVGENGIEPDTTYVLRYDGQWMPKL